MDKKRVPLYDRLPEIYKIKDEEQKPPGQLRSYLSLVEEVFGAIHENIESLYSDLFIETCDDWVIPYIGDLLGTSHLKGDSWTLRADVADTITLRRRKGTLASIERLTYNLTQWGVHCVELRENLLWNQHLNHQRPDEGEQPPYGRQSSQKYYKEHDEKVPIRHRVIRGGTVTLRDPAMLFLLNTPFDPFAHTADLKPPAFGNIRYNLPNLAIFLWRLEAYRVAVSKPVSKGVHAKTASIDPTEFPDAANLIARFEVHPMGEPVRLFNTYQFDPDVEPPVVTQIDETPGPIPMARLTEGSAAGNPEKYVAVDTYHPAGTTIASREISDVGLQLYLPEQEFAGEVWPDKEPKVWSIRGANLCAWETGLQPPLNNREIAIDPIIGRIAIGVDTTDEGDALVGHLLLTYTYGAVGPVGAHPISRSSYPKKWNDEEVRYKKINWHEDPDPSKKGLQNALNDIQNSQKPIVIEIHDSMTHELDLSDPGLVGTKDEDGGFNLQLNRSLIIRAAANQRPIIKLAQPLRFRPTNVKSKKVNDEQRRKEQKQFDAVMSNLTVRLEGLYLTQGDNWNTTFSTDEPLIARAALHSLEIINCTLDPGGLIHPSMGLKEPYGFFDSDEEEAFNQTPEIILQRGISGRLFIDSGYLLFLTGSIIDTGKGVGDDPQDSFKDSFAVSSATDPINGWGPPTQVNGITVFGLMRVESINGRGGIWVHALKVQNNQKGCIRFSYFSGKGDRLPQNLGCVKGTEAQLRFVSEVFGNPAYGQLTHTSDARIREEGPKRTELRQSIEEFLANRDPNYKVTFQDEKVYKLGDQMGAFGFLLEAHKWRNIQIRYREFMPVGVRPLLIPVT